MRKSEMENEKKDRFWQLEDLIPKREKRAVQAPHRDTEAVEIEAPPVVAMPESMGEAPLALHYVSPTYLEERAAKPKPMDTYEPLGSLLLAVRLYPWKNEYTYYESFCRQAKKLVEVEGRPCEAVSFFSYVPQYAQMSRAQLAYYLWWRTSFRRGECLRADYSYLLLYLFEQINLSDTADAALCHENMLRLWLSYREAYPRLDSLVSEWLCDHALLHRLPAPTLPREQLRDMIASCRLKEFYVSAAEGEAKSTALLAFCSNYDYRKSKFYREDTRALFDTVMPSTVSMALSFLQAQKGSGSYSTVTRDAYSGALCSWRLKRKIEVDYCSFSHTYELRYIVTDALKYAENALRAALGIKSRLTVYGVCAELRQQLDAYFKTAIPKKVSKKSDAAPAVPAYEQRYELPSAPISIDRAKEIEAASWQTTDRLIAAFEEIEAVPSNTEKLIPSSPVLTEKTPTVAPLSPANEKQEAGLRAALGDLAAFLPLAANGGDRARQREFAAAHHRMPDAIADRINTVAGDIMGDILLEDVGGYYALIEDYIEELEKEGLL